MNPNRTRPATLHPHVLAERVWLYLPAPMADAITTDPRWNAAAADISNSFDHDLADISDALRALANRLTRESANANWVAHQSAAPARWLYTNTAGR